MFSGTGVKTFLDFIKLELMRVLAPKLHCKHPNHLNRRLTFISARTHSTDLSLYASFGDQRDLIRVPMGQGGSKEREPEEIQFSGVRVSFLACAIAIYFPVFNFVVPMSNAIALWPFFSLLR